LQVALPVAFSNRACRTVTRAALFNHSLETDIEYAARHFKFLLRNGTVDRMSDSGVRRQHHSTTTDHL
jgi:hypothetical protein